LSTVVDSFFHPLNRCSAWYHKTFSPPFIVVCCLRIPLIRRRGILSRAASGAAQRAAYGAAAARCALCGFDLLRSLRHLAVLVDCRVDLVLEKEFGSFGFPPFSLNYP